MIQNEAMQYGDILMLWGIIFTMMGVLSIIHMGIMEGFMVFVITGAIFVGVGVAIFIVVILVDKKKARNS